MTEKIPFSGAQKSSRLIVIKQYWIKPLSKPVKNVGEVYDRYLVGLKTIFLQFKQGRNKLEIKRTGIRYLHLLLAILHLAALGDAVISFSLSLHLLHAHILAHIVTKRSWALPRRLFQIGIDSLGDSCSVFWNSQIILIFVCLLLSLLKWGKGSLFKGKRETNNTSKWFSWQFHQSQQTIFISFNFISYNPYTLLYPNMASGNEVPLPTCWWKWPI